MGEYKRLTRYNCGYAAKTTLLKIITGITAGEIHYRRSTNMEIYVDDADVKTYLADIKDESDTEDLSTKYRLSSSNHCHSLVNPTIDQKRVLKEMSPNELNILITNQGYALCSIGALLKFFNDENIQEYDSIGLVRLRRTRRGKE